MSLLFCFKVLLYCKVPFYCKINPLQKQRTILKRLVQINKRLLKFFENYFEKKYKSLSRIIKHNERYNCIRRKNSFIASAKIPQREGSISTTIQLLWATTRLLVTRFGLIYPVGEFSSFKEMETESQFKISLCCFVFGVNKEHQPGGVQDSLVWPQWWKPSQTESHLESSQTSATELHFKINFS